MKHILQNKKKYKILLSMLRKSGEQLSTLKNKKEISTQLVESV